MEEIQNPVLAVIDMQKGFINQYSNHITPNIDTLIRECRVRSIPVVFSRFFNSSGSAYETLMGWTSFQSGSETDIIAELVQFAEIIIDKNSYTALTRSFIEIIETNNWKTIVLCGLATESCVLKTAADAFEVGLRPIVVSDACASDRGDEFHQAGLKILRRFIGKRQIMTTHELLDCLDVRPLTNLHSHDKLDPAV